ncbi:MAG: tryptophan synthase subunit alpha [Bacteroidetes bacterium HGW-Bacteroidetes-1]|jgi:tryptophan synthase alpha chain|nr:MAG: tryptophan synthase subunit alpha [Bacteroidetes bacterium HGW-Bacteroidetes-1]
MNRIDLLLKEANNKVVNIYLTAGYPTFESIVPIIQLLEQNGATMIEVGIPFSDPLADGPVIQHSSKIALENGMTTELLFHQLKEVRKISQIPLVLMGYLNPVIQFGVENFLKNASECEVDGLILPDLPPEIFEKDYQHLFEKYNIYPIFLVTPQTSEERLHKLDSLSKGFVYAVSSSSTTGKNTGFTDEHLQYFKRLASAGLKNPLMIGFGISTHQSLQTVFDFASGAIIGSAFIKSLDQKKTDFGIPAFMNQIINDK